VSKLHSPAASPRGPRLRLSSAEIKNQWSCTSIPHYIHGAVYNCAQEQLIFINLTIRHIYMDDLVIWARFPAGRKLLFLRYNA
jgi:hypothetical protein